MKYLQFGIVKRCTVMVLLVLAAVACVVPPPPPATIPPGTIATIAGSGGVGPALAMGMSPVGAAAAGNDLYVADSTNAVVRKLDRTTGAMTVVAGNNGGKGPSGAAIPANQLPLKSVVGVAVDAAGQPVIGAGGLIRVNADGTRQVINNVSGVVAVTDSAAGVFFATFLPTQSSPAAGLTSAEIGWYRPDGSKQTLLSHINYFGQEALITALAAADDGTVYYSQREFGDQIFKLPAGATTPVKYVGPPLSQAEFEIALTSVTATAWHDGDLFILEGTGTLRRLQPDGVISDLNGPGGPIEGVSFADTNRIAFDDDGKLLASGATTVRQIDLDTATVQTVAGNGTATLGGDGAQAVDALLTKPTDTAGRSDGSVVVVDSGNNRLRRISTTGVITTLVEVTDARSVAIAPNGDVVFSTWGWVRRLASNGSISVVAGTGTNGFGGDNGPATAALLNNPDGLAYDDSGNLLIADTGNHRIRMVSASDQTISTVAGDGTAAFTGDNGPATAASLNAPHGVAAGANGQFFIADTNNNRVRAVDVNGTISTYAGGAAVTTSNGIGDGGQATAAMLAQPWDVAVREDVVLVSDPGLLLYSCPLGFCGYSPSGPSHRVRRIDAAGVISTVAGNDKAGALTGDGGLAVTAGLNKPTGLGIRSDGMLLIADQDNNRVRMVAPTAP